MVTLVQTEQEWERLVHTLGLVVVDIYSTWCGPCTAMDFHLKRLKVSSVEGEDKVSLARACCDEIEELAPFRTDPRPTWLFLSSGIPTALLRGANRPLLSKLFLSELELEREGRLPVYIDYKSPSVIQCVGPLGSLAQDKTIQSIGSGRTEMLSSLFQERTLLTPNPTDSPKEADRPAGEGAEREAGGEAGEKEDATDREIVDILLAADLGKLLIFRFSEILIFNSCQRMRWGLRMTTRICTMRTRGSTPEMGRTQTW